MDSTWEVILKNAGTLLLFRLAANRPPGGAATPTTAEEYRAKARECEQRAEKERDPSIKRQLLEEARRWLALAELCGEPSAVAASVGGLFSNSIIISTGLS
jgi:hypothetical protein